MRRIIVSTLFLSAAMLAAQSSIKGQGVTLEARSETPSEVKAPVAATQPVVDASSEAKPIRISTVSEPKLVKYRAVTLDSADFHTASPDNQKLILHFVVDETGTPKNIEVLKSVNQDVDGRVLNAVRQYRYAPAKLDGQVVASDLNLVVKFASR
jgi:protein TonB